MCLTPLAGMITNETIVRNANIPGEENGHRNHCAHAQFPRPVRLRVALRRPFQ